MAAVEFTIPVRIPAKDSSEYNYYVSNLNLRRAEYIANQTFERRTLPQLTFQQAFEAEQRISARIRAEVDRNLKAEGAALDQGLRRGLHQQPLLATLNSR